MGRWEPEIPDGLRLGNARNGGGAKTGHLFDDQGKLRGHAAWRWVEDGPPGGASSHRIGGQAAQEWEALLVLAAGALVRVGIRYALPAVGRWVGAVAVPKARALWARLTRTERLQQVRQVQVVAAMSPQAFRRSVEQTLQAIRDDPSGQAARANLVSVFMLGLALRDRMAAADATGADKTDASVVRRDEWEKAVARLQADDVTRIVADALRAPGKASDPESIRRMIDAPMAHAQLERALTVASMAERGEG
ncbi:hypothetical protein [Micrococcus luteus]|uniref:hypothetical protein n=1 Tax=Micrococcus luteus TaxID=1270 RepID=UPI001073BA1E|nr:hypothetical protein [Micrococcus luteus]MCV7580757.1 hypothetical protein [Micrococcus luteus]MCV7694183.1 hypothetical protein [Micrococcus luteus]TFI13766.1 hypothetical protein E4P35_10885 [Thiopseudomonas sp. 4R-3cl]